MAMYSRLADFPVLDEYPSRIPAPVWNVWRRILLRQQRVAQRRLDLPEMEPFQMILEDRLWVIFRRRLHTLQKCHALPRLDAACNRPWMVAQPMSLKYNFGLHQLRSSQVGTCSSDSSQPVSMTGIPSAR